LILETRDPADPIEVEVAPQWPSVDRAVTSHVLDLQKPGRGHVFDISKKLFSWHNP